MAMGSRPGERQESLWIETVSLPKTSGHPFYEKLNALLATHGFDAMAEQACAAFYADGVGRPSTPPGVYFRMLFIGFFEGIDSERGIAWRTADSMALRSFLGYDLSETTPDHSNLSRTRHRIDLCSSTRRASTSVSSSAKPWALESPGDFKTFQRRHKVPLEALAKPVSTSWRVPVASPSRSFLRGGC
jgi:hypothetical protein